MNTNTIINVLRYKTKTRPGLVALYDIQPGNGAGPFLQPRSPHGAWLPVLHWRFVPKKAKMIQKHHCIADFWLHTANASTQTRASTLNVADDMRSVGIAGFFDSLFLCIYLYVVLTTVCCSCNLFCVLQHAVMTKTYRKTLKPKK